MDAALGGVAASTGSPPAAARRGLLDRHAAADGQRIAPRRPCVLVHPHRSSSPVFSGCAARPSSIRWDGTTTACRPSAACRTTTACAAIRLSRTIRRSAAGAAAQAAAVSVAAELHRALRSADEGGRKGFEHLWQTLGPVRRLVDDLRDHRQAGAARVAADVPASAASAVSPTRSKRRRCGTSISRPPSRRPSSRTARCRARITGSSSSGPDSVDCVRRNRHDASGADSGLCRAGRASRRSPVPAALRQGRRNAAVRRAGAGPRAHACRSRKGQRHRDDLHLRRRHRRHLVARLSLPVRAVIQPDGTLRDVDLGRRRLGIGRRGARAALYAELNGLRAAKARAKIVEQLRESGDLVGEPRPITHAVKFYEKGDRPLEIVTSRQWFIKTVEFREALIARGRELHWHPEYMETRFENWANGLNGDWCVSRQRFFGVPFPVWYPLDAQGARSTTVRSPRARISCRSIRRRMCPMGIAKSNAASRAGSPAIPTSWTRGRLRRSRRKSSAAGLTIASSSTSRSRWTSGRRRTTSSARGCSTPSCARISNTTRCRGPTRRFPAGCSTRIGRRCRNRKATSSRRWRCSRSTGPTGRDTGPRADVPAPTPPSIQAR